MRFTAGVICALLAVTTAMPVARPDAKAIADTQTAPVPHNIKVLSSLATREDEDMSTYGVKRDIKAMTPYDKREEERDMIMSEGKRDTEEMDDLSTYGAP